MTRTRDDLLDQALALFAEKGYENVGVQAIVDAVGVRKPTLYHYFGSKTGLLEALLQRDYSPLTGLLSEAAHYNGDLTMTLESIARTIFRFTENCPAIYRFSLASLYGPIESDTTKAFHPYFQRQHEILSGVFLSAAHDHGNMKGRQAIHAVAFLGSLNGMITTRWHASLPAPGPQEAFLSCKYFMHGIFS